MPVLIGVDGGGTRSRLVAVRLDGTVLAKTESGGINYNAIGMNAARENLRDGVRRLIASLPGEKYEAISVGMSALDRPADAALLKEFAGDCFDAERLLMDSDVYMALMGATLGEPGVMVVSGTGAMIVTQDASGNVVNAGGWGYRLDDPGSAYGVAIDALREAMMYLEDAGEQTNLGNAALSFFDASDSRALIGRLYDEDMPPSRIAQFAQAVLSCAAEGDRTAQRVIGRHVEMLADLTAPLLKKFPEGTGVNLYGGMFEHNPLVVELFREKLRALGRNTVMTSPSLPPELGAVIAYLGKKNVPKVEIISRMRQSWDELRA